MVGASACFIKPHAVRTVQLRSLTESEPAWFPQLRPTEPDIKSLLLEDKGLQARTQLKWINCNKTRSAVLPARRSSLQGWFP